MLPGMRTMKATELRKKLFDVLDELESSGEPVQIMRFRKPIATLVLGERPKNHKPLIDLDAVFAFCKKYHLKRLSLFGSILTDDFNEQSDVDVLVEYGRFVDFHEECQMTSDLEVMFGRRVDLLSDQSLRSSRMNPIVRETITKSARILYDAQI